MLPLLASAASAAPSVSCTSSPDLLLVGLPPFELRCTAAGDDGTLRDDVTWRFGDGTTGAGATVSHTYDVGRYLFAAEFPALADETGDSGLGSEPSEVQGQVTVCGSPSPEFDLHFRGGLKYLTENRTQPEPGCIAELQWDVFRGEGQSGNPVITELTWEPELVFPTEDTYTVVLSVGGIGGVAAASTTIEADGGFTDAYSDAFTLRCDGTGAGGGVAALGLVGLLVVRRRR